jgi:molecular chaperone GrpE
MVDQVEDVASEDLAAITREVAREVAELRVQLARSHDRAAAREQIIDKLHGENERMRAGERQLVLRPVLTDLQRLRHEMLRDSARLPEQFDARQAADLLRSYAHNLELTLERGGVRVVAPAAGEPFDAASQRVTGVVPAAGPEQDTTVAEVVVDGYYDTVAERTVLAAAVRVHRWDPTTDETKGA